MEDTKVIEEELQHYDVVDDDEDWDYDEDFDDEEFDIDIDDDDEEDELDHSGIKGMKWGVRRFQNQDGSLTPAGRKRYGSLTDAVGAVKAYHIKQKRKKNLKKAREAAAEKKRIEAEQKAAAEQRKKDVAEGKISARNMTAEELQSRIDKLNLEKRYKQLMDETNPQAQTVSAGKALVKKFINEAVVPAAVSAGKAALTEKLTEQAKKQLGLTDDDLAVLKKEAEKWNFKQQISNAKKTVSDNDKKMNGEEDESARLKKEAEDAQNRWKIEQYANKLAGEKGYKDDPNGGATAADKMRTKEEAQRQVDEYNAKGYTQDTVTPEVTYPKSTKISNPPAVYEKAVTSLSNISPNSKEYSDMTDRGEKLVYEVLDKDGDIITRFKHSEIFGDDIAHWEISEEELQHWGIKGMKWGVRRYQNSDGSLTPAGKRRYEGEGGKVYVNSGKIKGTDGTDIYVANAGTKNAKSGGNVGNIYGKGATKKEAVRNAEIELVKYLDKKNDLHYESNSTEKLRNKIQKQNSDGDGDKNDNKTDNKTDDTLNNGKSNIFGKLEDLKPQYSPYGSLRDLETKADIGNNKNVEIYLNISKRDNHKEPSDNIPELAKKAQKFIDNYNDDKSRDSVASEYYDKNKPWVNDDPETAITRDQFKEKLQLESISIEPNYSMFTIVYRDGGSYDGHWLVGEGNLETGEIKRFSLEG